MADQYDHLDQRADGLALGPAEVHQQRRELDVPPGDVRDHRNPGFQHVDQRVDRFERVVDLLGDRLDEFRQEAAHVQADVVDPDLGHQVEFLLVRYGERICRRRHGVRPPVQVERRRDPRDVRVVADVQRQPQVHDGLGIEDEVEHGDPRLSHLGEGDVILR